MPQVESYCDSSMLYRTDQVVHPTQVKNTIVQGVGNMQQNGRHNIGQVSQSNNRIYLHTDFIL